MLDRLRVAMSKRTTLNRFFVLLAGLAAITACGPGADGTPTARDAPPETRLHFGARTALFVEVPPLVVGTGSKLAVHFTWLESFKPVAAGRVSVILGAQASEERFSVDAPSSPGIYGPVVTAKGAGERTISIVIDIDGAQERHDLGAIRVHGSAHEARFAPGKAGEAGAIKFLMEQQWRTDFATAPVVERALRPSLGAFGALRGRPEGDATVRAPLAGQVTMSGSSFPRIGDTVRPGQLLALLQPRFDATVDVASLARDRARRSDPRICPQGA